jgi:O-acetyl-ADP-ribose deacetylase (regulator of RNase III)
MLKRQVILWLILIGASSCRCNLSNSRGNNSNSGGGKSDDISTEGGNIQSDGTNNNRSDSGTNNNRSGSGTNRQDWVIVWEAKGNVQQASQWIGASQDWLTPLGIPKNSRESVVVNAANGDLGGGGGIDGALFSWAQSSLGRPFTKWRVEAKLPNGNPPPNPLPTGDFALFDTQFGWIYLAVGPIAKAMQSLDEAKQKVSNLYYNMLAHAHKDNVKRIVLPAISTDIFADDGKGFTKDEFIDAIFKAMIEGIEKFQKAYPASKLLIIINNWSTKGGVHKVILKNGL